MLNLSGIELASLIVSGLILIFLVIALVVQISLIIKYKQYNKMPLSNGLTAEQTARSLLDANGLQYVQIKKLGFFRRILLFGNHYSVMKKTIYFFSQTQIMYCKWCKSGKFSCSMVIWYLTLTELNRIDINRCC